MKVRGLFKDWTIGKYHALDGKGRSVWIANGFVFFHDDDVGVSLLRGLWFWERWLLWRELKKEMRRRSLASIADSVGGGQ